MSPMPQMAKARTRNPTTPPMMPLPSAEEEALRRPRSMATVVGRSGGQKPVREVAHHRDRPESPQLNGLRPFARAAGLLAKAGRSMRATSRKVHNGDEPPPAGCRQLEDERAQTLGCRGR